MCVKKTATQAWRSLIGAAALLIATGAAVPLNLVAADQWIEVKSAHFTIVSNASERSTRKLAWQLEQVRSATTALFAWAKPDLNKPLQVIAVKDENSMRGLAPRYWEERRSVRPASVWVTGADRHYLAIRTDVEVDDRGTINPYITAYFSYVGLILDQSIDRDLPLWFQRGFTGVLSNTIVRDDHILLGAPIPWELQILRERPLYLLPKLLAITRNSPEATQSDPRETFDAETWAFVHFLMFGDESKRAPQLNAYAKAVSTGTDHAKAFAETLGPVEGLQGPFRNYIQRSIFSFRRINLDVSVERERFPVRQLTVAESASARALFHAAMRRPVESRAAIAEARKADSKSADSYVAEGLLFDIEDKDSEAKAAFANAADLGSTNAYGYYRLASLVWQPRPSRDTLAEVEKHLTKAVELNTRYAHAYAWLGEIKAFSGADASIGLIQRAITLEPMEPSHRLRAASVLLRQGKRPEARVQAQAALTLATSDNDRREAQELLAEISKAGGV